MIIHERPPNFVDIVKVFPKAAEPGVVFAYGKDIFVPDGGRLPMAILAHEAVHSSRQEPGGPAHWWMNYLHDHDFRYNEELHAHVREFQIQLHPLITRDDRARLLTRTAQRLSAKLYEYPSEFNLTRAMRDLSKELSR